MRMNLIAAIAFMLTVPALSFRGNAGGRWAYHESLGKWAVHLTDTVTPDPKDRFKGWYQDPADRYWYYLDRDGYMLTGLREIDGIRYRFRDRPYQGNYWPEADGSGFYYYSANGRPTYGSLEEIVGDVRSNNDGHGGIEDAGNEGGMRNEGQSSDGRERPKAEDRHHAEREMDISTASDMPQPDRRDPGMGRTDLPMDRTNLPKDGSNPDKDRTDLPMDRRDPAMDTADPDRSEIRSSTSDIPESSKDNAPEKDPKIHSHIQDTDQDREPCISYDSWRRILKHPADYEDCYYAHCTSRLYLVGEAVSLPGTDIAIGEDDLEIESRGTGIGGRGTEIESRGTEIENRGTEIAIPLYVSLIGPTDSEANVFSPSARSGLVLAQAYASEALRLPMQTGFSLTSGRLCGNEGGFSETLVQAALNGGDYAYRDAEGELHTVPFSGFRLCGLEDGEYYTLPLREETALTTAGFAAESALPEDTYAYLEWRDGEGNAGAADISFLRKSKGRFRLFSEQELYGTAGAELPFPSSAFRFYPEALGTWRDPEAGYWLRSTPAGGFLLTDDPLQMTDLAQPGSVEGIDYTEARRHFLLQQPGARLDPSLFLDQSRAAHEISADTADQPHFLRLQMTVAASK